MDRQNLESTPACGQASFLSKIARRDFLRLVGSVALAIAAGDVLSGCGGGGSGSGGGGGITPPQSPIVFQASRQIGPQGDTIVDKARGITLKVPANALSTISTVTLTVRRDQIPAATPKGFTSNPNAIEVTIDPSVFVTNGSLFLEAPWTDSYTSIGTVVFLRNSSGTILPLTTSYDGVKKIITATVTILDLNALANGSALNVFIANAHVSEGTPAGLDLTLRNTQRRSKTRAGGNKRVAVIVHGMRNTGADLAQVAKYLSSDQFKLPISASDSAKNVTGRVYDITDNSWSYDWTDYISNNGARLAQYIASEYSDADVVDIYAHSMGGLVSRYAIETLGTSVRQLVTLGTPHLGVPLKMIQLFVYYVLPLLYKGTELAMPGLLDLVEGGPFLAALNAGGPGAHNGSYRAAAGTSSANYQGGLGAAVDVMYQALSPRKHFVHDGIVPQTSALHVGSLQKSVNFNHGELVVDLGAGYTIDDWVVTSLLGTLQ